MMDGSAVYTLVHGVIQKDWEGLCYAGGSARAVVQYGRKSWEGTQKCHFPTRSSATNSPENRKTAPLRTLLVALPVGNHKYYTAPYDDI